MDAGLLAPYALLLAAAVGWHLWRRGRRQAAAAAEQAHNAAAGLNEPASLHPRIDPVRCIGSGTCVIACPEGALGLVDGKASLINASACIGHGACHAACPLDAISLVFGTARRGVDIPLLDPHFQTNLPGVYIAGELGGMGLIRKAAEQGRQALTAILREQPRARGPEELDLLIVGAGPAGLSAGLAALDAGLRFAILEQESSLGGAIFHYPRHKVAMTAPVRLARVGLVKMGEISKEALLDFWHRVTREHPLPIEHGQRMTALQALPDGALEVQTAGRHWRARAVLLAIGRRGTPRTLDVPGEELPKVSYRLVDPAQYRGQHLLVVGGGDSALEAALALAGEDGTTVTLAYRSEAFSRVKAKNRDALEAARQAGRIAVRLQTQVERITPDSVLLRRADGLSQPLPNDAVIVCAGGVLPTPLLQAAGIRFETKHGSA